MSVTRETRQHGVKGVFCGGEWLPIEECHKKFAGDNFSNNSTYNSPNCATCPRSRTKHTAAKPDGTYDVVIIGAGCIGSAIARELSRYTCSVLVLEAADDISQGATKGNSGIVHAGYDDTPGSIRAKFCWPGNQMFPQLDRELHFGYQLNGSLVLARGPEEEKVLQELMQRGQTNGVKRLRILNKQEVLEREPYVAPDVTAALYSPDAGNMIPYEYAIALAENAADNGVEFRIRREVTGIAVVNESDPNSGFNISVRHWEPADYIKAVSESSAKASPSSVVTAGAAGIAAGIALTKVLLPYLQANHPDIPHVQLLLEQPHLVNAVMVVLCAVLAFFLNTLFAGKQQSASTSAFDVPTVGKGGDKVVVEEAKKGGSGSSTVMRGETLEMETIRTRYVVNAAGGYSDKIANMIGDFSFKIKPRLGDYILLNRTQGHLAKHTLFPCPHPVLGKGVLVQSTLWGQLILGPTARDMHLPEVAAETTEDILQYIISKCRELVPSFDMKEVFHTFYGARAKNSTGDWVIKPYEKAPHFIHAAGIDSPGIAGSPAIALEIVKLLREAGLETTADPQFNPNRAPIIIPKDGMRGIKMGAPGKYTNPAENVVCKCEKVTEQEIINALHRSLPIDSTQCMRKRTRAGMGHCQGDVENYNCESRVAAIIARETRQPAAAVGRRPWPATSSLPSRWLSDEQKQEFAKIA